LNNGDGTFRDVTVEAGCGQVLGRGMGVVIVDLDRDRWPEIFVANDMTPNYLYRNRRQQAGQMPLFEDIGIEAGVAFSGTGSIMADMGVTCGDVDGDSLLDLYVTHYHQQENILYRNLGGLNFMDVTAAIGSFVPTVPYLGFGCEFIDYDNDGWLDLYVVNGHVLGPNYPKAKMNPQLFHNVKGQRLEEVTAEAGAYFAGARLARGAASSDFDDDGAVDFAAVHLDEPVALLLNTTKSRGNAVGFELIGVHSNRGGINCEVALQIGGRRLVRQLLAGGSYQSSPDLRLIVGTGNATLVDRLEISWPSGRTQSWTSVPTNRFYLIREGFAPAELWRYPRDR